MSGRHKGSLVIILPFQLFLQQQYQMLQDKTNSSADSRQKKKRKNKMFSLISLSQSYTHKPETHTHRDTRTEAVNGTTEVLWVAVSQTLFLEQRINSRPSLPRHRHSAHSCSWQSRLSHLPFLDLCQNSLTIHHFLFLLYFTPYFCLFLFYLIFLLLLNSQSSR